MGNQTDPEVQKELRKLRFDFEDQLKELKNEKIAVLEGKLRSNEKFVLRLQSEFDAKESKEFEEKGILEKKLGEIINEIEKLKDSAIEKDKNLQLRDQKLLQIEETLKETEVKYGESLEQFRLKDEKLIKLEGEQKQLQVQLQTKDQELVKLVKQMNEVTEKLKDFTIQLQNKDEKLREFEEKLKKYEENQEQLLAQLKLQEERMAKLEILGKNVEDRQHNHQQDTKETDMLITQLEARCQSFDDEAKALSEESEKHKDENNMIKSKYTKLKQMAVNLKNQCQTYEEDFKKLQDENQSLEAVRKIKEKDAENEKAVLEAVIRKLRGEPKKQPEKNTDNRMVGPTQYDYDGDIDDQYRRALPIRPAVSTRNELNNDIEQIINRRPYAGKRTKSAENLYGENSYESRNQRYTAQTNGYHFESNTLGDPNISYSTRPRNNRHPQSRSFDFEVNNNENSNQEFSDSPWNHSPTSHPFCPTSSHDIQIGMMISLSRASGRLSRGQVKWIGTFPHHQGDYIGVELESESGKHDGTYDKVRYFKCKRDRGIFVQFKKIIMAWK
ncbi:golgin subfamily A member 6-like protein 22 [Clytia hemisphaerica]|uniref:CAP-Gly domain-containing protein n=1 Tax=Clytia hemisphaerica TaxID=252671 RepID=A0A7M5WZC8_9CNID